MREFFEIVSAFVFGAVVVVGNGLFILTAFEPSEMDKAGALTMLVFGAATALAFVAGAWRGSRERDAEPETRQVRRARERR